MSYSAADGFDHGTFVTSDGTQLAYQERPGDDAPTYLLANGLGGSYKAWAPFAEYLEGQHRLLTWDYRGLYRSEVPSDLATLSVERQCQDMAELLDHMGVDQVVLFGWSMGVQMNFEFCRSHPERVLGIVVINGVPGRPFETAVTVEIARRLLPFIVRGLKYSGPVLTPVMGGLASKWISMKATQLLGLLGPTACFRHWEELAGDFANLDLHVYFETMRLLGLHDASDVLPGIQVPVMIIAGAKDILTPARASRAMASEIPEAELMMVRGGTHYTPVEFPELLALRVDKYLRERIAPRLSARLKRSGAKRGGKRATA